jgi:glycosyltransferase 2 family protein
LKRLPILIIGILISVAALYFAFQGFKLEDVWDAMSRVRPLYFLLLITPYVLTFLTKVWRWRLLFYPDTDRTPFRLLFGALMISYIPLPFRLGELARAAVVTARTGLPPARVFSTILVEKVMDVLALLLLFAVSIPFVTLPSAPGQGTLVFVGAGVMVVVVVLLVLILRPDWARKLVRLVADRLPQRYGARIIEAADHALEGLTPLAVPSIAVKVGLWSIATWSINIVTIYLMMLAFNIEVPITVAAVLVVATNLSMVVPAAPGYVGTFEAAVVAVLVALGQPRDISQAFAIIYHFLGLVPVALLGVIAAIQQGINFAALRQPEEAAPQEEPMPTGTSIPVEDPPVLASQTPEGTGARGSLRDER